MHDQLLELYGREFELAVERLVELFRPDFQRQVADAFEANSALRPL